MYVYGRFSGARPNEGVELAQGPGSSCDLAVVWAQLSDSQDAPAWRDQTAQQVLMFPCLIHGVQCPKALGEHWHEHRSTGAGF